MIIPSIDIMDGKAVQLKQGKEKVLERENVLELAKEFRKYGDIAVIDLDAAFGKGNNLELIKEICKIADCRVGGGIRTEERANEVLQAGAKKIIIGTNATPEFLGRFNKERIIVAVDTKDNVVVKEGWKTSTSKTPVQSIKELEEYCSEFLFTNVNHEGLLQGCDLDKVKELVKVTENKLTIAGGISTIEELKTLEQLSVNSQLGMAIYTNKVKLVDAFSSVLDFEKNNGLIPTIVQDDKNQVLMMAYSSKESLVQTFESEKVTYFSRSRNKIWIKGETSGNVQKLIKVRFDCDKDTLLFTVKQNNVACHQGTYSCFNDKDFSLQELYELISDRVTNPIEGSYTSKIAKDEDQIKEKISEESQEVVNYRDKSNLTWEAADLLYFTMVLMAKNNVTLSDVKNELWRRRK